MKIIPIFLDYTGTINSIVCDKVIAEKFNNALKKLEEKTGATVLVNIISGNDQFTIKKRYNLLNETFKEFDKNFIDALYGEYGGLYVKNGELKIISKNSLTKIQNEELDNFIKKYSKSDKKIIKNLDYCTITNLIFENFSESEFYETIDHLSKLFKSKSVVPYYDQYGIECEIKSSTQIKAQCSNQILKSLAKNEIILTIYGGDNFDEDFKMFKDQNLYPKKFIAPKNITKIPDDKDVIITDKEEIYGIVEGLEKIANLI